MMTSKNSALADFHGFFAAARGVDAIALFAQDLAQQLAVSSSSSTTSMFAGFAVSMVIVKYECMTVTRTARTGIRKSKLVNWVTDSRLLSLVVARHLSLVTALSAGASTFSRQSSGSRMVNVVPWPGSLSARIVPACWRTIWSQMANPNPAPVPICLVVNMGSKMCAKVSRRHSRARVGDDHLHLRRLRRAAAPATRCGARPRAAWHRCCY